MPRENNPKHLEHWRENNPFAQKPLFQSTFEDPETPSDYIRASVQEYYDSTKKLLLEIVETSSGCEECGKRSENGQVIVVDAELAAWLVRTLLEETP